MSGLRVDVRCGNGDHAAAAYRVSHADAVVGAVGGGCDGGRRAVRAGYISRRFLSCSCE